MMDSSVVSAAMKKAEKSKTMKKGMSDMGAKMGDTETPYDKNKKVYPRVSISSKSMPGIKGRKPGDMVDMHVKCKIRTMRETENGEMEADMDMMEGMMEK